MATTATPAPPETTAEFWAARDAHVAAVKAKLQAVIAEVQIGVDADLYRDGITTKLNDVLLGCQHHVAALSPAQTLAGLGPIVTPQV